MPGCTDQSDLVRVNLSLVPPAEVHRIKGVGLTAHGLVAWRDKFVMLDSGHGALVLLDPSTAIIEEVWRVSCDARVCHGPGQSTACGEGLH